MQFLASSVFAYGGAGALAVFTLVAILAGSPIRIAISGILWLAVVVVYVVRFKRAMDEPEKLDDELRRMKDAERQA